MLLAIDIGNTNIAIGVLDKEKLKAIISKYYKRMDLVAPWDEEEKKFKAEEIENMKQANEYLRNKGLSRNETETVMAKIRAIHDQRNSELVESEIDLKVVCNNNLESLQALLKTIKEKNNG